ncbi:MAG: OmpA family protein [bacterium]|nr:OmpA family protein [bacterium]
MKRMMKKLLVLGIVSAVCVGCGNRKKESVSFSQPYNISFVLAIANNNPVLDTGIEELAQLPETGGTTYSCILADSTPSVICDGTIPDFSDRGYSPDMLERIQASVVADIIGQLENAAPDSDEVDIAAATSLAVRKIRSAQVEGRENFLVYYGSAISTSGLIDMTSVPLCDLDVETSAAELAKAMNVDMTGIRVVLYCCSDVAGEQDPLSENEKKIEEEFYTSWLKNMGAEEVIFMENVPPQGAYSFPYQVSVMKTEGTQSALMPKVVAFEEIEGTDVDEVLEEVFAEGEKILSFDDKSVAFLPDSTELAEPDAAMESLSYVISYMEEHPEFILMICGTTTSVGEQESCIAFSEKRAQAIRSLLIENAGIDESRMITLGCGWSSCLYVNDRGEDGSLNENAPRNRSVKLVNYDSRIASEIIQSLDVQ